MLRVHVLFFCRGRRVDFGSSFVAASTDIMCEKVVIEQVVFKEVVVVRVVADARLR